MRSVMGASALRPGGGQARGEDPLGRRDPGGPDQRERGHDHGREQARGEGRGRRVHRRVGERGVRCDRGDHQDGRRHLPLPGGPDRSGGPGVPLPHPGPGQPGRPVAHHHRPERRGDHPGRPAGGGGLHVARRGPRAPDPGPLRVRAGPEPGRRDLRQDRDPHRGPVRRRRGQADGRPGQGGAAPPRRLAREPLRAPHCPRDRPGGGGPPDGSSGNCSCGFRPSW
jgi:hypothetical protein